MSLDRLALFDLVLRSGSFAAAARREGLDPSSVSRAIAALEADLGTRLIARNTRRMRPTAAGEQLQADIAPHLVALERASARANAAQKAIRITASTTFARLCLVPVLAAFQRDNPDVTVDLRATDRPVDLVDERIDIAVRHGRLEDSALLARKLRNVDYWCVGRPDFDRVSTPEALGELPQLVFDLPGFRDGWTASQGRRQVRAGRRAVLRSDNADSLLSAALSGMGVALIADWTARDAVQSGALVRLLPDWRFAGPVDDPALWLVTPTRDQRPDAVERLIAELRSAFKTA